MTATVYSFFFADIRESAKKRRAARYIPQRPKFLPRPKKAADAYTFALRGRLRVRHERNILQGHATSDTAVDARSMNPLNRSALGK